MTWFKVDDSFHSHPKVLAASPAALGLWVVAGSWSSSKLQDGFVPDHVLPRLLPDPAELAKELVACGLWRRVRGGHQFHDFGDYNPDSAAVRQRRDEARERMKKLRGLRKDAAQDNSGSRELPRTSSERSQVVRNPDPTRPVVPTELEGGASAEDADAPPGPPPKARRQATRIPADFAVTPELVAWAGRECPLVDGRYETAQFIDHWSAAPDKTGMKVDWVATWRGWMRRAQKWAVDRGETARPGSTAPAADEARCPHHPYEIAGYCRQCPEEG